MYHTLITALYTQLGLPVPVAGQTATTLAINDELVLTLAEDAWLAADFPLDPTALAGIADQAAARFTRDHRL